MFEEQEFSGPCLSDKRKNTAPIRQSSRCMIPIERTPDIADAAHEPEHVPEENTDLWELSSDFSRDRRIGRPFYAPPTESRTKPPEESAKALHMRDRVVSGMSSVLENILLLIIGVVALFFIGILLSTPGMPLWTAVLLIFCAALRIGIRRFYEKGY